MNRSRLVFFLASSVVVLAIIGGSVVGASDAKSEKEDSLYRYLSVFSEVLGLVRQAYVEPVAVDTLMAGAMDGVTDALDPFSLYLPPTERPEVYTDLRQRARRLSGLTLLQFRGSAIAAAVEPGSPAAAAGIQPTDIISRLQGKDTRLVPLWKVLSVLAEPGTKVELEVIRAPLAERKTLSFELGEFAPPPAGLETVDGEPMLKPGGLRQGVLPAFTRALETLAAKKAPRLLLDLRGVAGGDPDVAYQVADLFTDGPLGFLKDRDRVEKSFTSTRPALWKGRIVVLVDRGTLGASEVLAAILEQKAGAELVGERTFGYAGHQVLAELASGARLLYTDAFYCGPDGEPIRSSLEPDLLVSERSRTFEEKDIPMRELILRRGLTQLRSKTAEEPERKAA